MALANVGYEQSRNGSFGAGTSPSETPSLRANAARFNSMTPHTFRPTSVQNQIGLSPMASNASAPSMSGRFNEFTGTVLPNVNTGSSAESAETAMKLRFMGDTSEV